MFTIRLRKVLFSQKTRQTGTSLLARRILTSAVKCQLTVHRYLQSPSSSLSHLPRLATQAIKKQQTIYDTQIPNFTKFSKSPPRKKLLLCEISPLSASSSLQRCVFLWSLNVVLSILFLTRVRNQQQPQPMTTRIRSLTHTGGIQFNQRIHATDKLKL